MSWLCGLRLTPTHGDAPPNCQVSHEDLTLTRSGCHDAGFWLSARFTK